MPTFSERATLLRDTERLFKLIILYNDDDDSDDVGKMRIFCYSTRAR